ncbi:MAG: hypothetical protein QNJ53_23305 [Pleurocapsa sp. MO_192.B19]|nr:hypothetical protein [Pleurocapsa sp. MO_192.B19]
MTQPFHFPNGQLAHNAEDLLELCQQFPADGTNYLVREDLEKWLSYIGKDDIAQCAANARQTALEDRQKLEEFLTKCHALSSPETESSKAEPAESKDSVAIESPVVETKEEQTSVITETPAVETKESPTPAVTETPTAKSASNQSPVVKESSTRETPATKTPETSVVSASTDEQKPSFFKAIARLIVNVLYRNKDKN